MSGTWGHKTKRESVPEHSGCVRRGGLVALATAIAVEGSNAIVRQPRHDATHGRASLAVHLEPLSVHAPFSRRTHGQTRSTVGGNAQHRASLPPLPAPTARHPLRLLVVGDSLGEDLQFGLADLLDVHRDVRLYEDAIGDTGLANVAYYNWPAHLAQDMLSARMALPEGDTLEIEGRKTERPTAQAVFDVVREAKILHVQLPGHAFRRVLLTPSAKITRILQLLRIPVDALITVPTAWPNTA